MDKNSLQDCLILVRSKLNENHVILFNINRRKVLEGACRAIQRASYKENARINVKFGDEIGVTEGAIDAGGPTREFLRLAVYAVMHSSIFAGETTSKFFVKCEKGIGP